LGAGSINGQSCELLDFEFIEKLIEVTPKPHFCEFRRLARV
jgi:hypothetical protein